MTERRGDAVKVILKWKGDSLMFGPFAVATMREATRMTGNRASYPVSGKMPVHVTESAIPRTNAEARKQVEAAVIAGLLECGIEAEVSHD